MSNDWQGLARYGITGFDIDSIIRMGVDAFAQPTNDGSSAPMTPAEAEKESQRLQEEADRRLDEFRAAIKDRLRRTYDAGVNDGASDIERKSYSTRSTVLLLVVLAVVSMPIMAIIIGLDPEAFGAYIAPVTAIAGTVVGYWFGSAERSGGKVGAAAGPKTK